MSGAMDWSQSSLLNGGKNGHTNDLWLKCCILKAMKNLLRMT